VTDRDDEELDDELRRLFADERLTLPVTVDVENAVVAGAKRRRRRRVTAAAASGVVAVAALVFVAASVINVGFGHPTGPGHTIEAAHSPSLTATSAASSTSVVDDADVLGPNGAAGVELGMPAARALQLGASRGIKSSDKQIVAGCVGYTMFVPLAVAPNPSGLPTTTRGDRAPVGGDQVTEAPSLAAPTTTLPVAATKPGVLTVVVSIANGVVVELGGTSDLHTPEGVAVGAQEKQVLAKYAQLGKLDATSAIAVVPGNPKAYYVFDYDATGTVAAMWLRTADAVDCKR
jgi:hypothetical protein